MTWLTSGGVGVRRREGGAALEHPSRLDSGFKIRDLRSGIQDSKSGIRDSGRRIRDSGFGIRDSGLGLGGSKFGIRDSGFGFTERGRVHLHGRKRTLLPCRVLFRVQGLGFKVEG